MKRLALLALIIVGLVSPCFSYQHQFFTGMAMTRLEGGQTWYGAVRVDEYTNRFGERSWCLTITPEPDFWTRDIDLMVARVHFRPWRVTAEVKDEGLLYFTIEQWGVIKVTPNTALSSFVPLNADRYVAISTPYGGATAAPTWKNLSVFIAVAGAFD